ncbi:U32 family peptidase [uncultured Desulfobulbus sp.]|uniref:U32 family peptidase n=1 Tax=uncultured Desulfobulbus sp. TaxID=239745 RepID=UPI0029C63C4E|nr:U32 family peptidase [uncultured Desulfobulbus sp.]
MRNFTVPTTFTPEFIDQLGDLNREFADSGGQVAEIYGSFQEGVFNSARPAKYLPAVSREQFQRHVVQAREKGIPFNYLFNAPSYSNLEYTHEGRAELAALLQFLVDAGVASVTVAIPYLVEIISSTFPQLEVVTSTIGYVGAVAGINQYHEAGAARVVLDVEVNRDFQFLRTAGAESQVPLEIIVNPVCISQCHFKYNHNCVASLGSQSFLRGGAGIPYNQYYLNWCFLQKLRKEGEFLKSPWVRPEDLHFWEEVGISYFKIAGRGLPGSEILRLCRSYLAREFSGNLLDLLGWPHWLAFRDNGDGTRLPALDVILDNKALEGFLEFFARKMPQCRLGCQQCGHCLAWSRKALQFNDESLKEKYIANMTRNIRHLVEDIPSAQETEEAVLNWQKQAASQVVK